MIDLNSKTFVMAFAAAALTFLPVLFITVAVVSRIVQRRWDREAGYGTPPRRAEFSITPVTERGDLHSQIPVEQEVDTMPPPIAPRDDDTPPTVRARTFGLDEDDTETDDSPPRLKPLPQTVFRSGASKKGRS